MNKKIEELKREYLELFESKKDEAVKYSNNFLKNNFYYRKNFKKDKISKKNIGKIYFVSGILHKPIKTKVWKGFLDKNFTKIEKEFFDKVFYIHPEKVKIKKVVFDLEKSLEKTMLDKSSSEKVIIFAHSFGGILAKTAISKLSKKNQKEIILVTLGTPHFMEYGMVGEIRDYLKTPDDLKNTKTFSFGGIYDAVVPAKYAHSKKSIKIDFLCEHMMFLHSEKILDKVFSEIFLD